MKNLYELRLKKYHTPMPPPLTPNVPVILVNNKNFNSTPQKKSHPGTPCISSTPSCTPMEQQNNEKNAQMKVDPEILNKLQVSLEVHVSQAESYYYNCDYQNCLKTAEQILKRDPYHDGCLPIYISCLVELKRSTSKFILFIKKLVL